MVDISIQYMGTLTGDKVTRLTDLSGHFNRLRPILGAHGCTLTGQVSYTAQTAGATVDQGNLAALEQDLKPRDFQVRLNPLVQVV